MNKITFLIVLVLTFPKLIFASSGACSNHNGVNCSNGPNFEGKVVCNDGWVNSSVNFSDVDECKIVPCDKGSLSAKMGALGMLGSPSAQSELAQCNNPTINPSIPSGTTTTNYNNLIQSAADRDMNNWCLSHVGGQSYWNHPTMNCECNAGFLKINNLCVNAEQLKADQQKLDKFNEAFDKYYSEALDELPQYKGIADKEVIRNLAKTSEYGSMSFQQIFEKLYPGVKPIAFPTIQPVVSLVQTTTPAIQSAIIAPASTQPTKKIIAVKQPENTTKTIKEQSVFKTQLVHSSSKNHNAFLNIWGFIKNIFNK